MTRKKEKKWARISKYSGLKRSAVLFVFFVFFVLALPGLVPTASNLDLETSTGKDSAGEYCETAVPFGSYTSGSLSSTNQIQAVRHIPITSSGGFSTLASSLTTPSYTRVTIPQKPKIYILVDEAIYGSITTELNRYIGDLRAENKYETVLCHRNWVDEVEVKNILRFAYTSDNMVGALFVGNIPVAYFEMENNFPGEDPTWVTFPMDLFYMDVDGWWEDTDSDGAYDQHIAGNGDLEPEIFIGRLYASTVTIPGEDEVSLIQNYFDKNHAYRTGNLPLEERALVFVDTPWHKASYRFSDEVGLLYPIRKFYNDDHGSDTHAYYYLKELGNEYEWVSVFTHSSQFRHTFDYDKSYESTVVSTEISQKDPTANFYNLHACKAARYTYAMNDGYIGGHYIFSETNGVCAVGHTKAGGMYFSGDFYSALSQGANIGEALLVWFANNGWTVVPNLIEDPIDWSYGMTILGDPTLVPNMP